MGIVVGQGLGAVSCAGFQVQPGKDKQLLLLSGGAVAMGTQSPCGPRDRPAWGRSKTSEQPQLRPSVLALCIGHSEVVLRLRSICAR